MNEIENNFKKLMFFEFIHSLFISPRTRDGTQTNHEILYFQEKKTIKKSAITFQNFILHNFENFEMSKLRKYNN